MTDIQVSVKAKIYWSTKAQDDTERILRKQSQIKLDELVSHFNTPLRKILEVLQSIPQ